MGRVKYTYGRQKAKNFQCEQCSERAYAWLEYGVEYEPIPLCRNCYRIAINKK